MTVQANGKEAAIFGRGRTITIPGVGILFDWGITVPSDGAAGYAPGCLFQDVDGSSDANFYINQGSLTSSNFDPIDIGTILASNVPILDTAGWFTATETEAVLAELGELLLANAGTAAGAGPSPLIWDKAPILETILDPTVGVYFFEDFMGPIDPTTVDGWIVTQSTSGLIVADPTVDGGAIFLDSNGNATADDGIEIQLPNCLVLPLAGRTIRFEARVKMNDTSGSISQFFIGLAGIDTSLIDTGVVDDAVDKVAFFSHAGTTADRLSIINSRTTEEEISTDKATVADNTWVKLGMVINGITDVEYYVDGVLVDTHATANAVPNAVMCLSFVSKTEGASKDSELRIDWVRIHQEGARTA